MPAPYPGRVHGAYAGQTKTLCGLTASTVTTVPPNSARARGITCAPCRSAIARQATK